MSFRIPAGFPKTLVMLGALIGMVALLPLFIDRVADPLVDYHGAVMRQSTMVAQANSPLFCQQLASFSFDANYACFNTQQELDAFAATR